MLSCRRDRDPVRVEHYPRRAYARSIDVVVGLARPLIDPGDEIIRPIEGQRGLVLLVCRHRNSEPIRIEDGSRRRDAGAEDVGVALTRAEPVPDDEVVRAVEGGSEWAQAAWSLGGRDSDTVWV